MKSIRKQREELSRECDSTHLYDHIGSDYEQLLDWAERARKLFVLWYGEPTNEKVEDFDTFAAWKLLEELPE